MKYSYDVDPCQVDTVQRESQEMRLHPHSLLLYEDAMLNVYRRVEVQFAKHEQGRVSITDFLISLFGSHMSSFAFKDLVYNELTLSTSCDSSPPPSILAVGLVLVFSGSSLLCFGTGRIFARDDAIEVIVCEYGHPGNVITVLNRTVNVAVVRSSFKTTTSRKMLISQLIDVES